MCLLEYRLFNSSFNEQGTQSHEANTATVCRFCKLSNTSFLAIHMFTNALSFINALLFTTLFCLPRSFVYQHRTTKQDHIQVSTGKGNSNEMQNSLKTRDGEV